MNPPNELEDSNPNYERIYFGSPSSFIKITNVILKRENAGYRIVDRHVIQITDENEIKTIEEAIQNKGPWSVPTEHLKKSSNKLFDRKEPDYSNSVKESISAVESACCIITGNKKATLGQALKIVEESHSLHTALKEAFQKLYGYTSDEGGIRHGSINMADVDFELAKYLLVTCSAFINYLKSISK